MSLCHIAFFDNFLNIFKPPDSKCFTWHKMQSQDLIPKQIVISITRTGKSKNFSRQTQLDQAMTFKRVKKNESLLPEVVNQLEAILGKSPKKKTLLKFANSLSMVTHISLDRLAKRSRDCLLCWFCENWHLFPIKSINTSTTFPEGLNNSQKRDSFTTFSNNSTVIDSVSDFSSNNISFWDEEFSFSENPFISNMD